MTTIISAAADRMIGQFNAYHAANIAAGLRGPALGDFHNLVVEMVAEALELKARMREITDLLASPCPFRAPRRGCPVTNQAGTVRPTRAVPAADSSPPDSSAGPPAARSPSTPPDYGSSAPLPAGRRPASDHHRHP
ncbi:hypothetical protein V1460_21025 [Streptomyces sp. SCSIO 30461]|uniref:hypothetical protein n=1 Tax=Streptomyces sp. SCSIO 30461 TaxID=3118085 RepID=UPI0030CF3C82